MTSLDRITRPLRSLPLLGLVLLAFSVGLPPFDDAATVDLSIHMAQHVLILVAGVLVAYPLYRRGMFSKVKGRLAGSLGALAVVGLTAFWHFPWTWDAAVLNPLVHAGEHLSFFAVGFLAGSVIQGLGDRTKVELLVLGFFANFFYGWLLISGIQVYAEYSLSQQGTLGVLMFVTGPLYWVGVIVLVLRNPAWLSEAGFAERARSTQADRGDRLRGLRVVIPVLTLLMLAALAGFYATSAVALTAAPNPAAGGPVVFISETPVSWQYSPQSIRVVLGENSTVTWVSRSISYDTVTGVNDSFSSGLIAPGQSFTHTFDTVGVFEYHCVYHPWMVGYVRVVAGLGG